MAVEFYKCELCGNIIAVIKQPSLFFLRLTNFKVHDMVTILV